MSIIFSLFFVESNVESESDTEVSLSDTNTGELDHFHIAALINYTLLPSIHEFNSLLQSFQDGAGY